ncbi:hypothetical protein HXX76_008611 [Chlamydomonas incerta]|uniref:BRCT domain-containing protein n=1 Tax=Chlamydomonas incerta TaxID=51695 RepID=A0A835VYR5_CHLIN|nr:hypothetical protein HXX76_008611 [Chlamydomonas incerta]|eukprot:KAG2432880.1 hypothetical protein HXX76_008611 [Chlamydomonas incerta]
MSTWARGIVVTTSGLGKDDKNRVQRTVKEAGGDYSPNLSKRCTHVLTVAGKRSEKLDAIRSNPATWPQAIVDLEWLSACSRSGAPLPPESFPVASHQPAQVPEARRPLAARQEPAASHASRSLFASRSAGDGSLAAGPATRPAAATGTRWVLDAHVKPEPLGTANKHATGPAAHPAALVTAPQPPATATTAHKPWRVHFSQVEEDPFPPPPTTHAQAAADAARRPWRVRVSSVPEVEDDGVAAAAGPEGEGQGAAGAMQAVEEDEEQERAGMAAGPGAAALLPAKPWLVRHMDLSVDDDDARRPRAQPAQPVARVHMPAEPGVSLDTSNTTSASDTAATMTAAKASASGADGGAGAGAGVRHPSAVALLEVLQSSQESGAASTASARGAAAAVAAGAGAGAGLAAPGSHLGHGQQAGGYGGIGGGGGGDAGLDGQDGGGCFEPSFTQLAADLQALRAGLGTSRPVPQPAAPAPPPAAPGLGSPSARRAMSPSVRGRSWDSRPEPQPQRPVGAAGPWGVHVPQGPAVRVGKEEEREEGAAPSWGGGPGLSQVVAELRESRVGLGRGHDSGPPSPKAAAGSMLPVRAGAAARYPGAGQEERHRGGDGDSRGVQPSHEEYSSGPGLSQLVAELRDARNGLGGGSGSGRGNVSAASPGVGERPPALLAAAGGTPGAPTLWSPPRDVLWGRGNFPHVHGGGRTPPPAQQQHRHHQPYQLHEHQPIDDVDQLEIEEGDAAEPGPGPLTQLIQGMQEARQGLQAGHGGGWQQEPPEPQRQDRSSLPPRPAADAWGREVEGRQEPRELAVPLAAVNSPGGGKQRQQAQTEWALPAPAQTEWSLPPLEDTEDQDYALADSDQQQQHQLAPPPAHGLARRGGAGQPAAGGAGAGQRDDESAPAPAPGPSLSQLVDSMRQSRQGLAGAAAHRDGPLPAGRHDARAAAAASPDGAQPWSLSSRGAVVAQQPQHQPSPPQLSPSGPEVHSPGDQNYNPHRQQARVAVCDGAGEAQGDADKDQDAAAAPPPQPQPAGAAEDISFSQLVRLMQRQKISRQQAEHTSGQQQLQEQEGEEVMAAGEAWQEAEGAGQTAGPGDEADDGDVPTGAEDDGADSDATLEPASPQLSLALGEPVPGHDGSAGTSQGDTLRVKPEVASPGVGPGPLGPCGSPAAARPPLHEPADMEWEARQRATPQPASPLLDLGYAAGAAAGATGRRTPRTQPQHCCAAVAAAAGDGGGGSCRPAADCLTEGSSLANSPLGGRIASALVAAAALPLPLSQGPEPEPGDTGADARGSDTAAPQSHDQGRSCAAQGLQVVVPGVAVAIAGHSPVLRPMSLWARLGPEASPQSPAAGLKTRCGIDTPTAAAGAAASSAHRTDGDADANPGGFGGFHVPAASQRAATTAGLRSPLPTAGGVPALWEAAPNSGEDGSAADMETGTPGAARTPAHATSEPELSFGFGVGLGELARADPMTPASVRGRTPARAAAGAAAAAAAAAAGPLGRCSGKAAARKMDSRTPSVLSTQGKHKRREVRATPDTMRGLQRPLPAPPAPMLWPEGSQSQAGSLDGSGAGLAAVAGLLPDAARQASQARGGSSAPTETSQGSAATSSQQRSQQGRQGSHSQGLALLLVGSQQQPQGGLLLAGGGGSLPQLGLEEVLRRRAHMPWAHVAGGAGGYAVTAGTGATAAAAPTPGRGAVVGWQGVCPSPMPITPGPWALGQDSDADDDVDEAAMLAAGRAAAVARAAAAVGNLTAAAAPGVAWVPAMTAGAVQLGDSRAAAVGVKMDMSEAGAAAADGTGVAASELAGVSSDDSPSPSDSESEDEDSQPVFNMARGRSRAPREPATATAGQRAIPGVVAATAAGVAPMASAAASPAAAVAQAALLALPPGTESQSQRDRPAPPEAQEAAGQDEAAWQQTQAAVSDAAQALGSLELREADDWRGGTAKAAGAEEASMSQRTNSAGGATAVGLAGAVTASQQQLQGSLPQVIAGDGAGGGGLLAGAAVIIDRSLSEDLAARCTAAVEGLGGHVSAASHLGCGAAAVVCEPSRAPRWMTWGAHLLSPRSLTRLAGQELGDASEPTDAAAVAAAAASSLICLSRGVASALTEACCQRDGGRNSDPSGDTSGGAHAKGSACGAPSNGGLEAPAAAAPGDGAAGAAGAWSSRAARRQLIIDLKAAEDSTAAVKLLGLRGEVAAAHLRKPPAAPPSLLDHLVWNVTQPPEAAQTLSPPADCGGCGDAAGAAADEAWGYGDSQGSQDEDAAAAPLACMMPPASQLQEPRAVERQELDAVVYADRHGVLGHSSLTIASPPSLASQPLPGGGGRGGITLRALLGAVQRHYAQPLGDDEVVEAMAAHPDLRRALQVAWQKAAAPPRSALLGAAAVLVGLRRCGQSGVLPVYELQLAQ